MSIKSNLPNEAEKLFHALKLFIGEPGEDYEGSIHELSLGGANLIFLTLKLLEYKYRKEKDKIEKAISLIDETLKEPIDETIFEATNEKIIELKNAGYSFELIGNDFNETKKFKFEEKDFVEVT